MTPLLLQSPAASRYKISLHVNISKKISSKKISHASILSSSCCCLVSGSRNTGIRRNERHISLLCHRLVVVSSTQFSASPSFPFIHTGRNYSSAARDIPPQDSLNSAKLPPRHQITDLPYDEESHHQEFSLNESPKFNLLSYQRWYFQHVVAKKCFGMEELRHVVGMNRGDVAVCQESNSPSSLDAVAANAISHSPSISMKQLEKLNETHGFNGRFFAKEYDYSLLKLLLTLFPEDSEYWLQNIEYDLLPRGDWIEYAPVWKERIERDLGMERWDQWMHWSGETVSRHLKCPMLYNIHLRVELLRIWYPNHEWHLYQFEEMQQIHRNWIHTLVSSVDPSVTRSIQLNDSSARVDAALSSERMVFQYCSWDDFRTSDDRLQFEQCFSERCSQEELFSFLKPKLREMLLNLKKEDYEVVLVPFWSDMMPSHVESLITKQTSRVRMENIFPPTPSQLMEASRVPDIPDRIQMGSKYCAVVTKKPLSSSSIRISMDEEGILTLKGGIECSAVPRKMRDFLAHMASYIQQPLEVELVCNSVDPVETASSILLGNQKSNAWWAKNCQFFVLDIIDQSLPFSIRHTILQDTFRNLPEFIYEDASLSTKFFQLADMTKLKSIMPLQDMLLQHRGSSLRLFEPNALYTPGHRVAHVVDMNPFEYIFVRRKGTLSENRTRTLELPHGGEIGYRPDDSLESHSTEDRDSVLLARLSESMDQVGSELPLRNLSLTKDMTWIQVLQAERKNLIQQLQEKVKLLPHQLLVLNLLMSEYIIGMKNASKEQQQNFLLLNLLRDPDDLYPSELLKHQLCSILGISASKLQNMLKFLRSQVRNSAGEVTDEARNYISDWRQRNSNDGANVSAHALQSLSEETGLSKRQIRRLLDVPGTFSDEDISFLKSWLKNHGPNAVPQQKDIQQLQEQTNLSASQIRQKLKSLSDPPGKITPQTKQDIFNFLESRGFSRLSKQDFLQLKELTRLSSTQLTKQIRQVTDPVKKDGKERTASSEALERWILQHKRRPNHMEFSHLKELTGLSSKQLWERTNLLLHPPRESSRAEIRTLLGDWLQNHNFEMPNEEQMHLLMKETKLNRAQLRKRLQYLNKTRDK